MDHLSPHAASAALLTVDMQADFALPGGAAHVAGTETVIPAVGRAAESFPRHGRPIVHLVRLYRPDGSNADRCRRAAIEAGQRLVASGTDGAELVEGLEPDPDARLDGERLLAGEPQRLAGGEWALYKPRWGGFYATALAGHLDALGVDSLVVAGCNFPNCPRATVYQASERDYRLAVVTDAVSGLYEPAEAELEAIGAHLLTAADSGCGWRGNPPELSPAARTGVPCPPAAAGPFAG